MKIRIRVKARNGLHRLVVLGCLMSAVGLAGGMAWLRIGASAELAASRIKKSQLAAASWPAQGVHSDREIAERPRPPRPKRGSILGRFEVPALKMSWAVLEGTDDHTLERGIGHVQGTATIGEAGNIGIAGHRHMHFRKLEWIRRGDEIVLTSKDGRFRYRVDYVRLHKPTDVEVLDSSHGPAVTLITCFPFEYVGSAPLRFVVRAVAVEEGLTRLLPPQAGRRSAAEY
jgi:sortase A